MRWLGVVDCLGYLVCRACNESGRGHRLESYVFGPPHSEECCDFCGHSLVAGKSPVVAGKSPLCTGPCESGLAAPCYPTCRWSSRSNCVCGGAVGDYEGPLADCPAHGAVALPGQGELPANLERDLRELLPSDWLDWTLDRGPQ
jgi:hypothetical protein